MDSAPPPIAGRIRLRPTRYGLFFLLVLMGMLLGSANYGNNLGFLVTFALAGMAAASVLAGWGQVRRAQLGFVRAQAVFAGQQACFVFSLRADAPAPAMELSFEQDFAPNPKHAQHINDQQEARRPGLADIPETGSVHTRLCRPAPRRGYVGAGPLRLATVYPLGLFRVWRLWELDAHCLVYPAPAAEAGPLQRQTGGTGHGGAGGPGVEEFKGLREYAPGDPLQRIAWKHSQRGQGLLTKEFEGMRGGAFVLDYEALAPLGREERLSRLCRQALEAHALGEPFALKLPHKELAAAAGDAQLQRCLTALALFGFESEAGAGHA